MLPSPRLNSVYCRARLLAVPLAELHLSTAVPCFLPSLLGCPSQYPCSSFLLPVTPFLLDSALLCFSLLTCLLRAFTCAPAVDTWYHTRCCMASYGTSSVSFNW